MTSLSIQSIVLGTRHRHDMGNIKILADSIAELGLLHPIVVTPENVLIAGERRLSAVRALGWSEVPVTVVDIGEVVRGELAENAIRKDFLPSEIEAIRRAMAPVVATPEGRPSKETKESFLNSERGQTRDKIGAFAGVSGRTVEKIAAVVEAAETEPEKYASLVAEMDRTGKVDGAYKKLRAVRQNEAKRAQPLPVGKHAVIYIDPPWQFEVWSGEGKPGVAENHYPTMTLDDIKALPVGELAADDCALFMWAVMPQLPEAFAVLSAWGFEYKTCAFVWVKTTKDGERFVTGMGHWTRANAEVCLLATKGRPQRLNADVQQVIAAPRMEHSRKPDEVAERIERLVSGPYLEMFARRARDGWLTWGNES